MEALDEEEAFFCGADRWGVEASRSGCSCGRGDPKGRDQRADFYRWKAKYAGLEVDQVRQMAQLQEENLRLKRLVADLTLDKTMLQDVLSKKMVKPSRRGPMVDRLMSSYGASERKRVVWHSITHKLRTEDVHDRFQMMWESVGNLVTNPAWVLLQAEFQAKALHDDTIRAAFLEQQERRRADGAILLRECSSQLGLVLSASPEEIVAVLNSLTEGLDLRQAISGQREPEKAKQSALLCSTDWFQRESADISSATVPRYLQRSPMRFTCSGLANSRCCYRSSGHC